MSERLEELGVVYNKSLILEFPTEEQCPRHLLKHFIRGYFDGDGSICYWFSKNANYPKIEASIVSTENFCVKLMEYLYNEVGIISKYRKKKDCEKTTRILKIWKNEYIFIFMNWLYSESTVYLKRKYDKYHELINLLSKIDYERRNLRKGNRKFVGLENQN